MKNVIIFFVIVFVSASFSEEDVTKYIFDPSREMDFCQEISSEELPWEILAQRISNFFPTATVSPALITVGDDDTTKYRLSIEVKERSMERVFVGALYEGEKSQEAKGGAMRRTFEVLAGFNQDGMQIPDWGFCFFNKKYFWWAGIKEIDPLYYTAFVPSSGTSTETRIVEEPSDDSNEVVTEGNIPNDGYVITE